jgi:hypothetical protein
MTEMPVRVTFEAETSEELLEMVRRWVLGAGPTPLPGTAKQPGGPRPTSESVETGPRLYRSLVDGVNGERSRRFLRQVARASAKDEAVSLSEALVTEYGGTKNVVMAGVVSGVNRRMKTVAGRLLIERDSQGYAMSRDDAAGVLAAFDAEEARPDAAER